MQKDFISMEQIASKQSLGHKYFNPLHANVTKWSNTFKHAVGNLPTNCLSVFDHFVGLVRIILILKFTKCPIDYKTLGWSLSRSVLPHGEGPSLALADYPSSVGFTVKIPSGGNVSLHQPAFHPIFFCWDD